jgi:hypothetical protein
LGTISVLLRSPFLSTLPSFGSVKYNDINHLLFPMQ